MDIRDFIIGRDDYNRCVHTHDAEQNQEQELDLKIFDRAQKPIGQFVLMTVENESLQISLGMTIGQKWVTTNGFSFELFAVMTEGNFVDYVKIHLTS